jgi:hypothetical protein
MQNSSWGGWVVMEYQARRRARDRRTGGLGATMAAMSAILPAHGLPVAPFFRPRTSPPCAGACARVGEPRGG